MKLHIYLFRHAQTYYNRDKRFTGWKDSKLTPFGIKQAKKVAKKLKGKYIDVNAIIDEHKLSDGFERKEIVRLLMLIN